MTGPGFTVRAVELREDARSPTFSDDERGAIMLIALFFAIFALAMLFGVVGTAESLFFREHMQDVADSAALSTAVMQARSMNFIVLVNIVMAALLAILVTIKLIEGLAIIGMAIAAALAWPTFGASLAWIPPLEVVRSDMEGAYSATKDPVFTALEALHDVADAVKSVAPRVAVSAARSDIGGLGAPVKNVAVLVTGSASSSDAKVPELPVEDDSFAELCEKAGEMPGHIAGKVFEPIGAKDVFDLIADAMGEMTKALSTWFCGDDGSPPPKFHHDVDPVYPTSKPQDECLEDASSRACDEARKFEKQARPDPHTGACDEEADCTVDGPYERRVAAARIACGPSSNPAPSDYFYQERKGKVTYFWTGRSWLRGDPEYESPKHAESKSPVCGPAGTIGKDYNTTVRKSRDVGEVLPVCSSEAVPDSGADLAPGTTREVEFTEVRHILACEKHEQVEVNLSVGEQGGGGGNSRSPKRVKEGLSLGSEPFQVRVLLEGDPGTVTADRIVRLALWNRTPPEDPFPTLRAFGPYSVAQAEYFYDGAEGGDAWMWNMKWRARLRRFRAPTDSSADSQLSACRSELASEICQSFLSSGDAIAAAIAH